MAPAASGGAVPEHAFHCFETINATLTGAKPLPPDFDTAEELHVLALSCGERARPLNPRCCSPLFVTWNIVSRTTGSARLRGCIGNFEASPIGAGLKDYAAIRCVG